MEREILFRIWYGNFMYQQEDIDYIDFFIKRAEFGNTYAKFKDDGLHLMQYTGNVYQELKQF